MNSRVQGLEWLERFASGELYQIKAIFNEKGIIFGPVSCQHNTLGGGQIDYKGDYKGNALAAMLMDHRIEIRHDPRFGEARLRTIIAGLSSLEELDGLAGYEVVYKGKAMGAFRSEA